MRLTSLSNPIVVELAYYEGIKKLLNNYPRTYDVSTGVALQQHFDNNRLKFKEFKADIIK